MRHPITVLRAILILLVLGFWGRAHADDRSEARAHYQAAVKYYSGGDYRSAIREFSAAQQLVPADLNNYNLALCYDKLGDAEPAIQYYRAFLDKQPNSDKRAEIEASINRLEDAARSAASKKADEARRAEEARKAAEPRHDDAPPAGPPAPAAGPPSSGPAAGPAQGPGASTGPSIDASGEASVGVELPRPHAKKGPKGPAAGSSIGTPSSGTPATTGDSQLDRVNAINIDEIRDQRMGAGSGNLDDGRGRGGPAVADSAAQPREPGQPAPPAPNPNAANGQPLAGTDEPKRETPVYKKWWFWAVVAVGAYVVYELATTSSNSSARARTLPPVGHSAPPPGGLTLFSW